MAWLSVVALVCACFVVPGFTREVVFTKQGLVMGVKQSLTYKGHKEAIYKFLGVPYAEKPIGDLRFQRPLPLKKSSYTLYNASYYRPVCIQDTRWYEHSIKLAWPGFSVDEDCLYLNIYTPEMILGKQYPVMVYIHGGSFVAGTPVRDWSPGEFIPLGGVVLVTVQYRLGVFGFFSSGTSGAPGNVGLLDQVQALKWVQNNIASFGGDPTKVTLLGESAGGASVTFLYLSPYSKKLFHRAIAISGVDFCPFAIRPKKDILGESKDIAKRLSCDSESVGEMLQCLRSVPASQLIEFSSRPGSLTPFVDSNFLPDDPKKMRKEGRFYKLPLMTGFVSHEGSFILRSKEPAYSRKGFSEYISNFLQINFDQEMNQFARDALEFQYTPWADVNSGFKIRKKLVEMLTDFFIIAPTHDILTMHSHSNSPSYMFEFSHRSKLKNNTQQPKWMGVAHGDTTPYKFGAPLLNTNTLEQFDSDDKIISDIMVQLYLNFAKYGDPTPQPVYGVKWHTYNASHKAYLKINKNLSMARNFHPSRVAFWNEYFPRFLPQKTEEPKTQKTKSRAYSLQGSALLVVLSCMLIRII